MEETRIEAKNAAQTVQNLRTPEVIAAEINYITQKTRETVLSGAIEIGRRLVEAKELVPHGQWEQWLGENVSYSQSTANNLMAVFREYGSDQQSLFARAGSTALEDLSYSKAVALLVLPREQREEFLAENPVNDMSTRQLQAEIKKAQEELEQSIEERQKYQKQAGEEMGRANKLAEENNALRQQAQEARIAAEELEKVKKKADAAQKREKQLLEKLKRLEEEKARPDQQTLNAMEQEAAQKAQDAAQEQIAEIQRELTRAQAEKEQIAKRLEAVGSEEMIQAKLLLAQLQEDFNRMLGLAMVLENKGQLLEAAKLKKAIATLCEKMKERVRNNAEND